LLALLTACSSGPSAGRPSAVAALAVSPRSLVLLVGQTAQLTAVPLDAQGAPLAGRVVTWATSDSSVATASGGRVEARAAGRATITATSEGQRGTTGVTVAPAGAGLPDPTLLPEATPAQAPLTALYDLLHVAQLAPGDSYLDPTTGVTVYRLTAATFPAASANWGHDYAEGGDEISLPYRDSTRAVLVHGDGGYWLVDFTPGLGVSNGRPLTGGFAPVHDQAFAFSTNPATPWYAYVSTGSSVRRLDIRTMTEAPGDGWPVAGEPEAVWLQQSENDGLFVWMRGQTGPTVVGYEPATATLKTFTDSGIDEPRIDRAGRYVGLTMARPAEALYLWDWSADSIVWRTSGDPGIPFIHVASLRDRWYGVNWNLPRPYQYVVFDPVTRSDSALGGPTNSGDEYGNGNWIQHPADLNDQWALFSHFEGLVPPAGDGWLAPGGMVFVTANGQRRLLGHPYTTISEAASYALASFVRLSSDGRYAMFTSDMNGAGRTDVFLVRVP
jgi:Bacterial Ig-like domain (group 2)